MRSVHCTVQCTVSNDQRTSKFSAPRWTCGVLFTVENPLTCGLNPQTRTLFGGKSIPPPICLISVTVQVGLIDWIWIHEIHTYIIQLDGNREGGRRDLTFHCRTVHCTVVEGSPAGGLVHLCASTMSRAQNRAEKGSTQKQDETLCPSG